MTEDRMEVVGDDGEVLVISFVGNRERGTKGLWLRLYDENKQCKSSFVMNANQVQFLERMVKD